jgi:hypothetical protein
MTRTPVFEVRVGRQPVLGCFGVDHIGAQQRTVYQGGRAGRAELADYHGGGGPVDALDRHAVVVFETGRAVAGVLR